MSDQIDNQRSDVHAVRLEDGRVRLLNQYRVEHGVIVGSEIDGEPISIKSWDEVYVPTVAGLKQLSDAIPNRQQSQIRGEKIERTPVAVE